MSLSKCSVIRRRRGRVAGSGIEVGGGSRRVKRDSHRVLQLLGCRARTRAGKDTGMLAAIARQRRQPYTSDDM
jgi:hypothetical protein